MTLSMALKWAWSEELPKVPNTQGPDGLTSAMGSITRYGELMTMVDRDPNHYGCIPFDVADFPHADAVRLAEAVQALDGLVVDVPGDWNPLPDLEALDANLARRIKANVLARATTRNRSGDLAFSTQPSLLITRHAILGTVPDWRLEDPPELKFVANANGAPRWFVARSVVTDTGQINADGTPRHITETVEVDGWSQRLRRPVNGAYRKPFFDPDPTPVMIARAEYEVFAACMAWLTAEIADSLDTIAIIPVDWPARPWQDDSTGGRRTSKILPDLSASNAGPRPAEKPDNL